MYSIIKILQDIELINDKIKENNRKITRNMIICIICMCLSIICLIIRLLYIPL